MNQKYQVREYTPFSCKITHKISVFPNKKKALEHFKMKIMKHFMCCGKDSLKELLKRTSKFGKAANVSFERCSDDLDDLVIKIEDKVFALEKEGSE